MAGTQAGECWHRQSNSKCLCTCDCQHSHCAPSHGSCTGRLHPPPHTCYSSSHDQLTTAIAWHMGQVAPFRQHSPVALKPQAPPAYLILTRCALLSSLPLACRLCKLDPQVERILQDTGVQSVITFAAPPHLTACLLLRVEGGMWLVSVGGNEGQYPKDQGEEQLLQFAREVSDTLVVPYVHSVWSAVRP